MPENRFFSWVKNAGRGIFGHQIELDESQLSGDTLNFRFAIVEPKPWRRPVVGFPPQGPVRRVALANWLETIPEYTTTLAFTAKATNHGAITTGTITTGASVKGGTYRLICTTPGAPGADSPAKFSLIDPDGDVVQTEIGIGDSTGSHLNISSLAVTATVDEDHGTAIPEVDLWTLIVYKAAGQWTRRNKSIYIKKTNTLATSSTPLPGAADDNNWALLVDASEGTVKGQEGGSSSQVRFFGPAYHRTNSSTRPATPADDAGTVGLTTGLTAAPDDWSVPQLQPTATAQYVYVSFVWLMGTVWKWTTPILSAQYQTPSHVKGDWDAAVTYERGDIIVSHGTLCILSPATSLNQNPEQNPTVWIRIRNDAVPWLASVTYAFGEHVSQHGKLYVLTTSTATSIDPSHASQTAWQQVGGDSVVEGILTRTETEISSSDEYELAPDVNTLLLAAASVPTATAGRFDDRLRFQSSELNDSESTVKWFTVAELDALTASDTYTEANSLLLYSNNVNGTFRAFKIANGNLVIRKTAGTGTTEFEVYIDHIYFTESMDRVQEVLKEITGIDELAGVKSIGARLTLSAEGELSADEQSGTGGGITDPAATFEAREYKRRVPATGEASWVQSFEALKRSATLVGSLTNQYLPTGNRIQIAAVPDTGGYAERFLVRARLATTGTWQYNWITRTALDGWTKSDTPTAATRLRVLEDSGLFIDLYRQASGQLRNYCVSNVNNHRYDIVIDSYKVVEGMEQAEEALKKLVGIDETHLTANHITDAERAKLAKYPDGGTTGRPVVKAPNGYGVQRLQTAGYEPESVTWDILHPDLRHGARANPVPPFSGQAIRYARQTFVPANLWSVDTGKALFYRTPGAGGPGSYTNVVTMLDDLLGGAADGYGNTYNEHNEYLYLDVERHDTRGHDRTAFYTQIQQTFWGYDTTGVMLYIDENRWIYFIGQFIANGPNMGGHCNIRLNRVEAYDLTGAADNEAVPGEFWLRWGFAEDKDTVPELKIEHTRFRLAGANQPTLPTLAGWDGSAFASGNANQTTEFPAAQDESESTHLWIFHATSTRASGPGGAWTTTAWSARRATDPDGTTYSAQYSVTGTGQWFSDKSSVGNTGYTRWRLDSGEWQGPFWYGPLPAPPTIEVEYSATETGTYSSTALTEGWFRWKLSTETTWAGPFPIAGENAVTIPTLDVQYSATETGTYTSTVLTEGFYRFRYNNGPWIGPAELGATPAPATPAPGTWTQLHSMTAHEGAFIAAGHPFADFSAHEEYRFVVEILDSSSVLQARGYRVIDTDDLQSIVEASSYDSEDGVRFFFDRKFGLALTTHQKSNVGGASGADQAAFTLFFTRPSTETNTRRYTRIRTYNRSGATVIVRIQVRV